MMSQITCDVFAERLADFLEREVGEPTRAAMEAHALECSDCESLLADLRKLRIDAAALPELTPSRDLWSGIAARIDAPVIPIGSRETSAVERGLGGRRRWLPLSAAAAALIAVTSLATYSITMRGVARGRAPAATTSAAPTQVASRTSTPDSAPVRAVAASVTDSSSMSAPPGAPAPRARLASNKASAEEIYGREIARLHTLVEQRRTQLDPITIGVIERNLQVIDAAIKQCRAALAKDPSSRFLMESLNNALDNKVQLLRTAAMLPSRT